MWNKPCKKVLEKMPKLYETENVPLQDKIIKMHFFIGGCDWYAVEYGDGLFWGYAILNGDYQNAEWGYASLDEMDSVKVGPGIEIDFDLYWNERRAEDVEKIREGNGWTKAEEKVAA